MSLDSSGEVERLRTALIKAREIIVDRAWYPAGNAKNEAIAEIDSVLSARDPMSERCPDPVVPGWTIRECFAAKKCSCARGVELGYEPTTATIK